MASVKDDTSTFKDFLQKIPPGSECKITDFIATAYYQRLSGTPSGYTVIVPEIELHCDTDQCNGVRSFKPTNTIDLPHGLTDAFLIYACKNCDFCHKTYALRLKIGKDGISGNGYKYGEVPAFGPPLPPRLITLIRPQRDLFAKGLRCENQGLGIAAFAYYRRVIEDQKSAVIGELIKACERANASSTLISELTEAKKETQFDKAVGTIRHALPQNLLIRGNNPLTLIHTALSRGLHAKTDEDCLEMATSIRLVMIEFADRLTQILKEQAELDNAVTKLLQSKATP